MTWTSDLLAGVAAYLVGSELDPSGVTCTFETSGAYDPEASPWPIVMGPLPPAPDLVIGLTPYPVDDDPGEVNDSILGVQVRLRGDRDPRTVDDQADAVFDRLHAARMLTLNGIRVALITHASGTDLGPDSNGRHQRTANYYLQATRPSTHRPD